MRGRAGGYPERDGYSFAGWYKDSACTIAWIFSEDAVPGDITLYAKWTPAESPVPTVTETSKPDETATSVSTAAPTLTQAPAPVFGMLAGLLAAGLLIRRRE